MKRKTLSKIWHFLWEEDSLWSWVANIIIAFVLIKFIIYPLLGIIFGTSFPIVAVVSGSMEHDGSFDEWWQTQQTWYHNYNITKTDFRAYTLKNGFNCGDLIILKGVEPQKIDKGTIIVFFDNTGRPIIHRIVKINNGNNLKFQTKGDHNFDSGFIDINISPENIVGKAILRVPLLGYVKIVALEGLEALSIIEEQQTCINN